MAPTRPELTAPGVDGPGADATEADSSPAHVGRLAVRGLTWAYGSYVGGRALILVTTTILARLLSPSDFGLVALALVFMTFLDAVRDLGLTQALVGADAHDLDQKTQTVFVGTVAIGATLAVLVSASAPLVASVFGHRELTLLVPALAVNFLLQALGATHDALAKKRLDYRTRTMANLADVVVRGVSGVALALAGAGVWSLVVGYVVGTLAKDVVLWRLVRWRPRARFPRRHLRQLTTFGGTLTLVDVGSAVVHNVDYLVVGGVLGSTSLGLYTIGFRLPELLIINLAIVAADVLFPTYAALDRRRLFEGFLLSLRYIAVLVLPLGVALAVLAEPIVLTVFGDKFAGSVEVMRLLALYAVVSTVDIPAGTVYKVTGRARILVLTTIPHVIVLVVGLLLVADRGILAVAWVLNGCMVASATVRLVIAQRMFDVSPAQLGGAVLAPAVGALATGAVLFAIDAAIGSAWVTLLVAGPAGLLVYGACLWRTAPDVVARLRAALPQGR